MAAATQHLLPRRFSIDEFTRICDDGVVSYDERLELLDGLILKLYPRDAAHIWAVGRLLKLLVWDDDTILSPLGPLEVGERSMLRPDIAVVWASTPRSRAPEPRDIPLVIEVAEHSYDYDRDTKGPIYARVGIAEYWLVNLKGEQIEVYREPSARGYRTMRFYGRGETITPVFSAALHLSVDTILGPVGDAEEDDDDQDDVQGSADEQPPAR